MINLSKRSYQKELLDDDNLPFADIRQNMKELNTINTTLGGHQITISGIKALLSIPPTGKPISICEIGCGGGDNLKAISDYCTKHHIPVQFIGIDIKPACIEFAKQQYPHMNTTWITSDYEKVQFNDQPAIIFSSLFCHHFTEPQLVTMLHWMKANASAGFFINDLHRHPLAYYSIKWITRIFSSSYLVKNDAPVSVARGFKKDEWISILNSAGIKHFSINWKWAFRYLVICRNE